MRIALMGLLFFYASCAPARSPVSLVTTAERTQYRTTGRYDEAVQLCRDFARTYAGARCVEIGRTGQDRPIVALRIVRRTGAPVIFVQAGIHAGEIEGKDAGFAFFRDLLDGKVAPGALDAVGVVFVPVLNPDGHERFGPNQRPNQRGPEQMGFRTNAARLNANRDYVKADSPEIQAVLGVVRTYDPVLLIDLHTTDGAKFEHDISINTAPIAPRADQLDETAAALSAGVVARLATFGHLPLEFYPSFVVDDDPKSGFAIGEAPPRFSHCYMSARGRLGLLVETHSWRTYKERADSTYRTLQATFELAVRDAAKWRAIADDASRRDAELGGSEVTLAWKNGPGKREIEFRGYAYERKPSELSGGTWIVYDETKPEIWKVPLIHEQVPAVTVTAPRAGYIVDGGFARQVAAVLDRHGLSYTAIAGEPSLVVEVFRATKATHLPPFEGRTRVTVAGDWSSETRTLERGALFVPIAQPHARLVLHLFEPTLPDSLVQWGQFNTVFERKEYVESYVMEEQARAMLAADPELKGKFDAAIAEDPELAASPGRRLDWFYRRSPLRDDRHNLIPVFRTATDPRAAGGPTR